MLGFNMEAGVVVVAQSACRACELAHTCAWRSSTPSNLISAKSSISTNTSITRTGLLSSMKSSRHSGNSVHCPRSASSTKRLIYSPAESRENHSSSQRFHTARVKTGKAPCEHMFSALPQEADIPQSSQHVRLVPILLQKSVVKGLKP